MHSMIEYIIYFLDVPFRIVISIETKAPLFASFEIFSTTDNKLSI